MTRRKIQYDCKAVIITTGTFLNGLIHIGLFQYKAGRAEEFSAENLTNSLIKYGLKAGRLKTGTPARVNKQTIDFSKTIEQKGDKNPIPFSFSTKSIEREQISCYITYTTEATKKIIEKNLNRSPLYGPKRIIQGIGPRYCPSIEDKVVKFPHHIKHQIFLEPEGYNTEEIYVNGFSTSLPEDVQYEMYRTVPGLEQVDIIRPAYAIEYDFIFPTQLKNNLETKQIKNLFLAGQINGTSGYEEAAGQGLLAGINAVLNIKRKKPFILTRSDAYIGVMIDDLITKGVDEPYRLFTSRAEYRLLLRCDNADQRLMQYGYNFGLISKEKYQQMLDKYNFIEAKVKFYKQKTLSIEEFNKTDLAEKKNIKLTQSIKVNQLIKRPEIELEDLELLDAELVNLGFDQKVSLYTTIKYEGYIKRELENIKKFQQMEKITIPDDFDYDIVEGLSIESKQRLKEVKPNSFGQVYRIRGIRPSDIPIIMIYLKKKKQKGIKR